MLSEGVPARDWKLVKVVDRGAGNYYRYQVEGENLNWPEGHRERRFCWSVPSIDDPRYDHEHAATYLIGKDGKEERAWGASHTPGRFLP